jgi:hypothetical protein
MSWTESAEFRKYLRSEVRKQNPWLVTRNIAFIALCIFAVTLPSWLNADPDKRLPIWALPIPPTIAAVALGFLFVILPQRLSKSRITIKENGVGYGPLLYGRQWLPLAAISSFFIEDEQADSGHVFTFLELFQMDDETISIEIPSYIRHDNVRELLLSLGLKEGVPEEAKD